MKNFYEWLVYEKREIIGSDSPDWRDIDDKIDNPAAYDYYDYDKDTEVSIDPRTLRNPYRRSIRTVDDLGVASGRKGKGRGLPKGMTVVGPKKIFGKVPKKINPKREDVPTNFVIEEVRFKNQYALPIENQMIINKYFGIAAKLQQIQTGGYYDLQRWRLFVQTGNTDETVGYPAYTELVQLASEYENELAQGFSSGLHTLIGRHDISNGTLEDFSFERDLIFAKTNLKSKFTKIAEKVFESKKINKKMLNSFYLDSDDVDGVIKNIMIGLDWAEDKEIPIEELKDWTKKMMHVIANEYLDKTQNYFYSREARNNEDLREKIRTFLSHFSSDRFVNKEVTYKLLDNLTQEILDATYDSKSELMQEMNKELAKFLMNFVRKDFKLIKSRLDNWEY